MKWPFFFVFLFFVAPQIVLGQVVITEIMYDLPVGSDSGREWVEVYNAGSVTIDLTKLRLYENGTNHKIVAVAGASVLAPASYAVIADNPTKFNVDWPQYSGELFDSTFALGNSGDTLEIHDASSTSIDTISFTSALGAAGDGNSLNRSKVGDIPTPHTPSPGAPMSSNVIPKKEKTIPSPKIVTQKKSTKSTKNILPISESTSTNDFTSDVSASSQVAAVDSSIVTPAWEWWLAAGLLAISSAGAVVFARRYAKNEWDIMEEETE